MVSTDVIDFAPVSETEVKAVSPSPPPSLPPSLPAPVPEALPSAAPSGLEEPQPVPSIPNKLPSEGKNYAFFIALFKIDYPTAVWMGDT